MEKRDKIIITGMIIVIIALVAGLAFMFAGNNLSVGGAASPEGMKMYDFNSEFKMAVPNDVKFLKSWNNTDDAVFGGEYKYFDKNNEIVVSYIDSPMVNHEIINNMIKVGNSSGNATFDFEGDLIISHNVKNNGKVGKSADKSEFKESILLQKGHVLVRVSGNDLDLIKSMIKTVEFCE